ncbi:Ku protein [Aquincola sp. MAHUQ-54]|uniref:Non-homologous end joining protein Ku n=1 Tax=Aquincola agrisoli TaxID=3119538 RepID=A0AAW9QAH2_9BURK
MPRVIWKGAISFGLVHIPVALYPASREDEIDFDWLDARSMDPVGYKRVNKRTGREIAKEHIVKGVKLDDGEYVLVSDDDIREAYPRSTQTIEIERFVAAAEIPFVHLERPYYLAPINKGEKVYALLREALLAAGRVGVAKVVIQSKQHLAALIPAGPALMLNTLRWAGEIRPWDELSLPPAGRQAAGLKDAELKMAAQLVEELSAPWQAGDYSDQFKDAVMALVERKSQAGDTREVTPLEPAPEQPGSSNVVDLTALLKRSLAGGASGKAAPAKRPARPAAKAASKAAAKRGAPARKAARRRA